MEHVGIFLLVGFAFGISYFSYQWLLGMGAVTFCSVVELAQLMISGRQGASAIFS
jgi:hypothetical protein